MCFGGEAEVDTTIRDQMLADAERARQDEEARKARIQTGTANIDTAFGNFNDGFYDGFRDNYMSLYQPELDQQFGNAKDDLTFAFARSGTLKSSMAGKKLADLLQAYDNQRSGLLADAEGATGQLRSRVANEKSGLVSLLNATGDSERAGNEALSRSQILFQEQPDYKPLGDIFAGFATGVGNAYAGMQDRAMADAYFGRTGSTGSSRVVR